MASKYRRGRSATQRDAWTVELIPVGTREEQEKALDDVYKWLGTHILPKVAAARKLRRGKPVNREGPAG